MNYFSLFFRWFVVYSTVSWHYSTAFRPLAFNPHTLEIYDSEEENSNQSKCQPCAYACPSQFQVEKDFQAIDYRYRSVFIQQVVDEPQEQHTNGITCKREIRMAVLRRSKKGGKLVELGFEVYFEKSKFEDKRIVSGDFYEFERLINAESIHQRWHTWKKIHLTVPWGPPKSIIAKWGFLWISKMQVRYDFTSRILTSMRYKVRSINSGKLRLLCHDHELYGISYNMNRFINNFYMNWQSEIFKKVEIPKGSCRSNHGSLQCVRKHNLVLPYQFQVPSQDEISCSNITTIPLWNHIPEVLMFRMQLFLIAIARVLGKEHELIVLPGVLGQLTLPSLTNNQPTKIYLDVKEGKLPVPKTIYKVVRHRTYECDEKKGEKCWFDVMIVIHNYPEFTENERLCPTDVCEKFGWGIIQYLDSDHLAEGKSPSVYCCELNEVTAKSIAFPLGETSNSPLNLRTFFMYDHSLKGHREVKILDDVMQEFENLIDVTRYFAKASIFVSDSEPY